MKNMLKLLAGLIMSCAVFSPVRAEPIPISFLLVAPGEKEIRETLIARLRQLPYFSDIDAKGENSGSSVYLTVSIGQVPTTGGTAASATTGLLAASTLGIIPTFDNKDISVYYELRSHHTKVASFSYSANFTAVANLYTPQGKLSENARKWAIETVDRLAEDIRFNEPMIALQAEYDAFKKMY